MTASLDHSEFREGMSSFRSWGLSPNEQFYEVSLVTLSMAAVSAVSKVLLIQPVGMRTLS